MIPSWLRDVAWVSLSLALLSALAVAVHVARHPQRMWVMNVVWPVTALWAGPLGLWAYLRWGSRKPASPAVASAKAATHCGAGCTLGDVAAETLTAAAPWRIAGLAIFGTWIIDFVAAYVLGIVFQYFTIKPMRELSPGRGLVAALKADTLSLIAWQVGMYGWMAIVTFAIFRHELPKSSPVFWAMMQVAMFCGFAASYPVNAWMLKRGLKERM